MRDNRLDGAKGVLIVLVVLGHLLEGLDGEWEDGLVRLTLTCIYAFHMPAFVFLAGVTAKSKRLLERLLTFAVLLVTFQCLYYLAELWAGDPFAWSWTTPHWILWFLLGMIGWTLTVPLVERFPRTLAIVSVAVSISAGLAPFADYEFSLSRMLVFWPFFVLGRVAGPRLLKRTTLLPTWTGVGLCAVALVPMLTLFIADISRGWLYGSKNFDYLDTPALQGLLIRFCLIAIALLAIFALAAVLPDARNALAVMGERSLSIYLLHGFAVIALAPTLTELFDGGYGHAIQIGAVVLCACAALGIAHLLALRPVHRAVAVPAKRIATTATAFLPPGERRPNRH
ncbi:acyltransferase family protein [Brevibacterium yomogidense]|uniref:acyltransferase family protein n=1 Tax=Brevibacterium yomogidense TaxID=946573 RepID=UPI0018E009C1